MNIILASKSPSRANVLKSAGIDIKIIPSDVNEDITKKNIKNNNGTAKELSLSLSKEKALKISEIYDNYYIIGADQVLEYDNKWYDKPYNKEAAIKQLKELRGKTHKLVNGISIIKNGIVEFSYNNEVKMKMRNFSDDFLNYYINNADEKILYCCGSYRLEGLGSQLFDKIEGDFFSVLGMPLLPILEFYRNLGILKK